jgi:hypothetical protein
MSRRHSDRFLPFQVDRSSWSSHRQSGGSYDERKRNVVAAVAAARITVRRRRRAPKVTLYQRQKLWRNQDNVESKQKSRSILFNSSSTMKPTLTLQSGADPVNPFTSVARRGTVRVNVRHISLLPSWLP